MAATVLMFVGAFIDTAWITFFLELETCVSDSGELDGKSNYQQDAQVCLLSEQASGVSADCFCVNNYQDCWAFTLHSSVYDCNFLLESYPRLLIASSVLGVVLGGLGASLTALTLQSCCCGGARKKEQAQHDDIPSPLRESVATIATVTSINDSSYWDNNTSFSASQPSAPPVILATPVAEPMVYR